MAAAWAQVRDYYASQPTSVYMDYAVYPAVVEFVGFWGAALILMSWDARNLSKGTLRTAKLATKYPLDEPPESFWWNQLRLVPLVLFNQIVTCVGVRALVAPYWASRQTPWAEASWMLVVFGFAGAVLIMDFVHWFLHRLLHTGPLWRHIHGMHHRSPQTGIAGSYNHPLEHSLIVAEGILPMALLGYPLAIHTFWSFAQQWFSALDHGGYIDQPQHNAHHFKRNYNFSFLLADRLFGTYYDGTLLAYGAQGKGNGQQLKAEEASAGTGGDELQGPGSATDSAARAAEGDDAGVGGEAGDDQVAAALIAGDSLDKGSGRVSPVSDDASSTDAEDHGPPPHPADAASASAAARADADGARRRSARLRSQAGASR